MPDWPVNHRTPSPSKVAVLRFASGCVPGSSNTSTSSVVGSTRTIAFSPPSVIHGAPSGPTITPCGAEPDPRSISRTSPVAGSRWPSTPLRWPVYQTPPSAAGATSCGWLPAATGYSTSSATGSAEALGASDGAAGDGTPVDDAEVEGEGDGESGTRAGEPAS